MPEISVIVPVYKVEKYIHRCIDSILAQTFRDFELILVDDGSPDNCGTICDEYAAKDIRVVVIHQENGGLSAARNAGIDWAFANSDSQWLTFIDSDDWVHQEYLQQLLDAAVTNDICVSICGYVETEGEEPTINTQNLTPVLWNPEDFFAEYNVNATIACAKLYRKECFAEIRYPVGRIHEDEFVTYRVLFQHEHIAVVEAPLYFYYQNEDGIMGSKWSRKRLDYFDAAMEQIAFFEESGLENAAIKVKRNIIEKCVWYLSCTQKKQFARDMKMLRKKLRKYMAEYSDRVGLEISTDAGVFAAAYPRLMWCYWTCVGIMNKNKRGID